MDFKTEFTRENVHEVLSTLLDQLHWMRREGERDMRTAIQHAEIARNAILRMEEK